MTETHEPMTAAERAEEQRALNRERSRAYRSRQRRGVVWAGAASGWGKEP